MHHALLQIDDAAAAETAARLAGLGIKFKQTRVDGGIDDALGTDTVSRGFLELVVTHATAAIPDRGGTVGIELPAHRARIRVDRGNAIIGCTGEHRIADLRRRILIDGTLLQRSLLALVVGPANLQILHVVTVDLR